MNVLLLNSFHLFGIGLPLILYFLNFEKGVAIFLIVFLLSAVSVVLSYVLSRFVVGNNVLSHEINDEKVEGLKNMGGACFSLLWLIPRNSLLPVSDAAWSISLKKHRPTVRAALESSKDVLYFILGLLAIGAACMAYIGEYGLIFSRAANYFGDNLLRALILAISSWVSSIFLINYLFRIFVLRD